MVITVICVLVRAVVYNYKCIPFGSGWVLDGSGVDDDDVITAGDRRTGEEVAVVWVLDGSGFPVLSRAGNRTAHLRLVPGES